MMTTAGGTGLLTRNSAGAMHSRPSVTSCVRLLLASLRGLMHKPAISSKLNPSTTGKGFWCAGEAARLVSSVLNATELENIARILNMSQSRSELRRQKKIASASIPLPLPKPCRYFSPTAPPPPPPTHPRSCSQWWAAAEENKSNQMCHHLPSTSLQGRISALVKAGQQPKRDAVTDARPNSLNNAMIDALQAHHDSSPTPAGGAGAKGAPPLKFAAWWKGKTTRNSNGIGKKAANDTAAAGAGGGRQRFLEARHCLRG